MRTNRGCTAVLNIELETAGGFDLGRTLPEINPRTDVVFLTACPDCALGAWKTEGGVFMVKPLPPEGVREQLKKLRHPFSMGGADE